MKNHFLSRFDADNLRKTIIYFGIALPLIIISLVLGIEKNGLATFMFFVGIPFFFYAVLRPWGNAKYYGIMCIIIILITLLSVGIGILTKMQLNNNLGKEIGEYMGFIVPIGVIVGIIGIFRFRKYD
jgi:ABC-type Na+ efflux pump permease subunit